VARRFFTAFCTFSNELTSIWRTRNIELGSQVPEPNRFLGEPTRLKDAPLAIVEHGER
jgi:hypothetical protein